MARSMKAVAPPRRADRTLIVVVDPLRVARGPRAMPRGGVHATARRPGRARAKRQWRELAAGA